MKQILFYLSCAVFLVLSACTEPITVGSDLLSGDNATLGQTVDIPFTTRVVRNDSLLIYDFVDLSVSPFASPFSIGILDDDVFGKQRNSAYVVPVSFKDAFSALPVPPPFSYTTERDVDSVVLIIPIDTSYGFYGPERTFPFTARLVEGRVDDGIDYYTDVEFPVEMSPINSNSSFNASLTPTPLYDTLYNALLTNRDTLSHIRVTLNDDFLARVNTSTSATFDSDQAFAELIGGLYLEPQEGVNGILALEPLRTGITPVAGLYFFYKDTTEAETPRIYRAPLALWPARVERDYTGSLTEDLLAEGEDRELLSLSGQAGTMVEITFTDLEALSNKVINKAEMFFFRELVEGYSYDAYPSPAFVGLYYKDSNGDLLSVVDRIAISATSSAALAFLGGDELFDENNNPFYNPRFTVHLQRMISGELPPTLYLRVLPVDRDASRVILTGPDAAIRPASMKVTFTEIGG